MTSDCTPFYTGIRGTYRWIKYRSEIYLRDRGICWICGDFVLLSDYDLGHIIDDCRGGKPTEDNLTVMHHYCNSMKPKHATLEDAINWRNDVNNDPYYKLFNTLFKKKPPKHDKLIDYTK
jgi:5-methylcytosine-specific restriction endonuclease McrA